MRSSSLLVPVLLLNVSCFSGSDDNDDSVEADTGVPDWTVPDTGVPDSSVPDTSVPDNTVSCAGDLTLRTSMQPSDGFLSFGNTSGFAAVRPDNDTLSAWLFTASSDDAGWYTNAVLPAGIGSIAEAEVRPLGTGIFAALARTSGLEMGADLTRCDDDAEVACRSTDYGASLGSGEGSGSGAGTATDCTQSLTSEEAVISDACFAEQEAVCRTSGIISAAEIAAVGDCLGAMNSADPSPELDALFTQVAEGYVACLDRAPEPIRAATAATNLARSRCEEAISFTSGSLFFARLSSGTLRASFTDTGLFPADGLNLVHDVEMASTPNGLLVAMVGAPSSDLSGVEIRTVLLDPATGTPTAAPVTVATDGCILDREARDLTLTGTDNTWFLLGTSLAPTGLCLIPISGSGNRRTAPVRLIPGAAVDYAAAFAQDSLWIARGTPMASTPIELTRLNASGADDSVELIAAPFSCPLSSLKESAVQVATDGVRIGYTALCGDGTKHFYIAGRTTAGAPISGWVATVDSTRNAFFPGGSAGRFNYLYDATTDFYRVRSGLCETR